MNLGYLFKKLIDQMEYLLRIFSHLIVHYLVELN